MSKTLALSIYKISTEETKEFIFWHRLQSQ
jgi:hypothetical protein